MTAPLAWADIRQLDAGMLEDSGARSELGTQRLEIAQHPDVAQFALVGGEESGSDPLDTAAGGWMAKKIARVNPRESNLRGRTVAIGDQRLDVAPIAGERRRDHEHVITHFTPPSRPQPDRTSERDVRVEDLIGFFKIDFVPELLIEDSDQIANQHESSIALREPTLVRLRRSLRVGDRSPARLRQLVRLDTEHVVPRSRRSPHLVVLQQVRVNEYTQLSAVTERGHAVVGFGNPSAMLA